MWPGPVLSACAWANHSIGVKGRSRQRRIGRGGGRGSAHILGPHDHQVIRTIVVASLFWVQMHELDRCGSPVAREKVGCILASFEVRLALASIVGRGAILVIQRHLLLQRSGLGSAPNGCRSYAAHRAERGEGERGGGRGRTGGRGGARMLADQPLRSTCPQPAASWYAATLAFPGPRASRADRTQSLGAPVGPPR